VRKRRWGGAAAAGVLLLVASACAKESSSGVKADPAQAAAVAATAKAFTAQSDPNGLQFSDAQGRCVARRVVDDLGMARLSKLGLDPVSGSAPQLVEPPLTKTEADQVFAAMGECVDLEAQVTALLVRGATPRSLAECIAHRYMASSVPRRAIMAADSDPAINADVDKAMNAASSACGGPAIALG